MTRSEEIKIKTKWISVGTVIGGVVIFLITAGSAWGSTKNAIDELSERQCIQEKRINERLNDHELRMREIEPMLIRIDENVRTLKEAIGK
jgi:ribosomal protein L9